MPRIFDNIDASLLPALRKTLQNANLADFCVGYFNLRGWRLVDDLIEMLPSNGVTPCRLLIGMHVSPQDELRAALSLGTGDDGIDQQAVQRLRRKVADEFREQLVIGAPTNADERGLRRLSDQLKNRKVAVKLHLRYPLHAKLYLLQRTDADNPMTGYLGSSNLTLSGLSRQGELNVDVLDHDACEKLYKWFNDRWRDRWCLDISEDLADIIDASWARQEEIPPYHIYLKIAYHLSQEAREGQTEFRIPAEFGNQLFDFQVAAVKLAAQHLNKRRGVMIGDVVGLGKTLMATALARIFEEDLGLSTLIICPKNLVRMWEDHAARYRLHARVVSLSNVERELPDIPARFRLVLIDESHNLRNQEGKRYSVIRDYISQSDSRCIMLTATPYNKDYRDLSSQLRLFVSEHQDLGIRPEAYIRALGGETEFLRLHQAPVRSLAAFEQSDLPDDWRELMRLFLVRRTRSFIKDNYAETDPKTGRAFLTFGDGSRSYFPARAPKSITFKIDEQDAHDQYALLFAQPVVDAINHLNLPRYGLGNYVAPRAANPPTQAEARLLEGLSRAGQRLKGFSRTNLFKRLESSGSAFVQSVDRHILRNYVFIHAIEHGLPLPIGSQDPSLLDPGVEDEDIDATAPVAIDLDDVDDNLDTGEPVDDGVPDRLLSETEYRQRAAAVYRDYAGRHRKRFKWLNSGLFVNYLREHLLEDAKALQQVLEQCGAWNADGDAKLAQLVNLLIERHPREKVLIFTQFADTVRYLTAQLKACGIQAVEGVTGGSTDPTMLAWRFSPVSNDKRHRIAPQDELRVLISTDVLSEGQNLQDAHVVVNYDLPWAIIRLIQRVGRVDRIGQNAAEILAYTFVPADGVEQLIRLRSRVLQRLRENAEVVGSDEQFFEDGPGRQALIDLYNEKAGVLDGDADGEVDLASYAWQIWQNAVRADPRLDRVVRALPDVAYSSREHDATSDAPEGVLVYMRTAQGNDALAWIDRNGKSITQSQLRILQAAACHPDTAALPRHEMHHDLVNAGVQHLVDEERTTGGQLGRPSGARYKTYVRLKRFVDEQAGTLFVTPELTRAIDEIYRYPLRQTATDTLNRQLRSGIRDQQLAELVVRLREDDKLCVIHDNDRPEEPRIICSLGLWQR